jgi:ribosomal protein L14E/L6E/L27E
MFKVGDLVISQKGRDEKRIFLVVEKCPEEFVLLADGVIRKIEKPKRKKIKHIKYYDIANERIMLKLAEGKKITNAELKKMIKSVQDAHSNSD